MSLLITLIYKLFHMEEYTIMAIIYATLIIKGKKTLAQVPALLRKQVEEILKDLEVEIPQE